LASHSGLCARLLTLLALGTGVLPVAAQEFKDRAQVGAQVIGPRDGESWRTPDARVVKTVVIRPVPQPAFRGSKDNVRQSPLAGDFWTPDELSRLQPPRGSFRAPSEEGNSR